MRRAEAWLRETKKIGLRDWFLSGQIAELDPEKIGKLLEPKRDERTVRTWMGYLGLERRARIVELEPQAQEA